MPLDYATVDEIRRDFIPQLSTSEDPTLAKLITWSSRTIDRLTNRQRGFGTSTADETLILDGPPSGEYGPSLRGTDFYSYSYNPRVDIASLTTLKLALNSVAASSGTYTSIATADLFLQPANRPPGWPAQYIDLAPTPNGTYSFSTEPYTPFVTGMRTVQLIGRFGFGNTTSLDSTSFPQEIRLVAVEMVVKNWRTRETGYSNVFGSAEVGIATVTRQLSPFAQDIVDYYTRPAVF